MAIKERPISRGPAEEGSNWYAVFELLKAGHYEQAAEYLQTAMTTTDRTGDGLLVDILAAARRICLACGQCQAEAAWHRRAIDEANRRERELRRQVYSILNSVDGRLLAKPRQKRADPPPSSEFQLAMPEQNPPESVNRPSFFQRIQDLLGWWGNLRSVDQKVPAAPLSHEVDQPAASSDEAVETVSALSIRRDKPLPTPIGPVEEQAQQFSSQTSLVVYCLGSFQVYQKNRLVEDWSSRKGQAVFKYLVAHPHSPISKDILMDNFWPEAEPEAARRNLHQAIYALRQTLKRNSPDFQYILFDNDCYRLNPNLSVWLDYESFERHFKAGQQLEESGATDKAMVEYGIAEGLYRGEFMAEDLYEEWPQFRRQHLWQLYLTVAHRLANYYLSLGEYAATIALSQRILTMDNCQEEAHHCLMKCYLAQGQRHLAIRQFQLCVQAFHTELNLSPSNKVLTLYKQITER